MHPPTGMHIALQLFSRPPTNPTPKAQKQLAQSSSPEPGSILSAGLRHCPLSLFSGEMQRAVASTPITLFVQA